MIRKNSVPIRKNGGVIRKNSVPIRKNVGHIRKNNVQLSKNTMQSFKYLPSSVPFSDKTVLPY
ncbi:hypothetical protein [Salicibibacter kimchii]|uniref:hypothetical protein n=1 Tax=Salicibibacter kimchii TaxID=2099786 RepID=UPI0013571D59|nr:hypothetical protein [Salicibibacter kimchii]